MATKKTAEMTPAEIKARLAKNEKEIAATKRKIAATKTILKSIRRKEKCGMYLH